VAIPAGSVAQLWALPKDGSAAFPVGVVPGSGTATVALADTSEKLFFDVSRLAVSIEAAPAKPGDKPSGDFRPVGALRQALVISHGRAASVSAPAS